MIIELEPCPFCNAHAEMVNDNGLFLVECPGCRAAGGRAPYEAKAAKFWNRRAPQASPGSKRDDTRNAFYTGFEKGWETIQGILAPVEIPKEAFNRLRGAKGVDQHWAEYQPPAAPSLAVAQESTTAPAQGPDAVYSHPMATIKLYDLRGGTEAVPTILAEASASVKALLENGMIRFMAAPGAAPTTEKGGWDLNLSQLENSEIINPALDEACDLIMRERDEQMHREWQRAERQMEKRIAIVSRFRTKKYMAQLRDLMDEVRVIHCQFVKSTGKGEKQKSEYPALKWEWVDQYESGGYSGDSYAGYIYLEVKPGRFLRLQYSM